MTKEKEFQEKCTKIAIQLISVAGEVDTSSLSKAMSQIGLKYIELTKLKQQLKELEEEKEKEGQEKEKIGEKCQELIQQNAKLSLCVIGKLALQGARHLI